MARLFEVIEEPLPGWTMHHMKRIPHFDAPTDYEVGLLQHRTGRVVQFSHESLHVAWLRAVEAAHMSDKGLDDAPPAELNPTVAEHGT